MIQEPLDLKKSLQLVRRHKIIVGAVALLGLLAGAAWPVLRPPMLSSEALVLLPSSTRSVATQAVIASSDPVLSSALARLHPGMTLQTLEDRVQVKSRTATILAISAAGKTATEAKETANAVADSYVAYIRSGNIPGGEIQARVLEPATIATGTSLSSRIAIAAGLGALVGALIAAIGVLAFSRRDRRLRERDEIADSIGIPVLASIRAEHPSDAAGWAKLFVNYEPGAVDAWRLRKALQHLGLADLNLNGSRHGSGSSLAVLSFASDLGALALGPQLAVFAASRGISTALVVGPQQDVNATATLRAACAAPLVAASRHSNYLRVTVKDHDSTVRQPDVALTIVVAVVDGQAPQVADTIRTTATVLAVSAGAATAEQLARVAASAAVGGHDISGILVADPDPADPTTGRLPQLARPSQGRRPTRMTTTTLETRL
jgi:capsular polysaccharide biosynthesis protein